MTNLENYRPGFTLSNGSLRKGPAPKKHLLDIVHLSTHQLLALAIFL